MEPLSGVMIGTQLVFTVVAGLYFYTNLRNQQSSKTSLELESKKEIELIRKLRAIKLNKPLSEKTRPTNFSEIVGQERGIKALRAALSGANPQHIIIYGPPGVGKTAAARLALEDAKDSKGTPFSPNAPFVEIDATITQFDERSIADPLIGSVHDPIYQGAGAYGSAGIPQPKQGAVTTAHGGVLFIDEIGELHPLQMNKLLKVLEDGKVNLSSSYYSSENKNIPQHVHDIFSNGLPADFRLIGATTRSPEELPSALRSRCTEIFFKGLNSAQISEIVKNACKKTNFTYDENIPALIAKYCQNGRDSVNIIQTSSSIAFLESRRHINLQDVEEVLESGRKTPNISRKAPTEGRIGVANGLAVAGGFGGILLEIETTIDKSKEQGKGQLIITGIIEEEEINSASGKMRRISTAKNSVENASTILRKTTGIQLADYDIHLNFPGGVPIDGPSAGIAVFISLYSALTGKQIPPRLAMTGEISIKGKIYPVGGVESKIEGAIESGIERVLIPTENYRSAFQNYPVKVIPVEDVSRLLQEVFVVA